MGRRLYSHDYRRRNPSMFPEVCGTCIPQRRFKLPSHQADHDRAKHSLSVVATPFHLYSSLDTFAYRGSFLANSNRIGLNSTSSMTSTYYNRGNYSISTQSNSPYSPLYGVQSNSLDKFVKDEIEPDRAYNASCNAVVGSLSMFMQNNFPSRFRPAKIVKSGSLGKGTAVKGKSDADLVVFLANKDFYPLSNLQRKLPDILMEIKMYLKDCGNCDVEGTTAHAVKVSLRCHGHEHDVDILPSVDILDKESKAQIYSNMEGENDRELSYYSAALAPLQIDFVSRCPTKLKSLIRLLKYWRKTAFAESDGYIRLPSSYPLELIAIGEWQDADAPQNFDLRKGFYNVLKALVNYEDLKHLWFANYRKSDVPSKYLKAPYVMDPANPYNNVMDACNCWNDVKRKANECLEKPLFFDLAGDVGWV